MKHDKDGRSEIGRQTPETLKRKRAVAEAIMARGADAPDNIGEGLSAIGQAIIARRLMNQAQAGEKAGRASAAADWAGILGGGWGADGVSSGNGSSASSGGSAAAPFDMSGNEIFSSFMDTVKSDVSNPYALAAIAATADAESKFSPANVNRRWSDPSESGEAGTAGGIMSWRNDRLANLEAFGRERGEQPGSISPATQAAFFLQEDPNLIASLNKAGSVEEAQRLMDNAWRFAGFDRPGTGEAAERMALANSYLPTFQDMEQGDGGATAAVNAMASGNLGDEVAAFEQTPEYLAQFPAKGARAATGPQPLTDAQFDERFTGQPATPSSPPQAVVAAPVAPQQPSEATAYAPPQPAPVAPAAALQPQQVQAQPTALPQIQTQSNRVPFVMSLRDPRASDILAYGRSDDGRQAVASAMMAGGNQPTGGNRFRNVIDAMLGTSAGPAAAPAQPVTSPRQSSQPGSRVESLMVVIGNPFTPEGRRQVAAALLEREMERSDPNYALDLQIKQEELNQLRNPVADPYTLSPGQTRFDGNNTAVATGGPDTPDAPTNVREYEYYASQEREAGRQPLPFNEWSLQTRRAAADRTTVDMGNPEKKFFIERSDALAGAPADLQNLYEMRQALEGGVINGALAEGRLGLAKVASLFGFDSDRIENTEMLISGMADRTLSALGDLKGVASETDRAYAERAAAGQITYSDEALRKLFDIQERALRARVDRHNLMIDRMAEGDPWFTKMSPALKVTLPEIEAQDAQQVPEGVDPSDWEFMTPEEKALFQ